MADDLHRQIELSGHAPDHHQLLVVLGTKDGDVRLHHIEQLGDDGGDAAEVSRSAGTAQDVRQNRDLDEGLAVAAVRIHFGFSRRKQTVIAGLGKHLGVALRCARIGVQILSGTELQGIDKDTGNDPIRPFQGITHQRQMAGVQVAHGRDQPYSQPGAAPVRNPRTQRRNLLDGLHLHGLAPAILTQNRVCSGPGKAPERTAAT